MTNGIEDSPHTVYHHPGNVFYEAEYHCHTCNVWLDLVGVAEHVVANQFVVKE